MTKILALSGSLRRYPYNSGLLRAAEMMPAGATLTIGSIADIPLYHGDEEQSSGVPQTVERLKEAIAGADGLLLATPEYNGGIPGVFKNAIDYASRPNDDIGRVFGGRKVSIVGASPGGFGTVLAQDAWLGVLRALGTQVWSGGRLMAAGAGKAFTEDGTLTDPAVAERLRRFMAGFVAFVRAG